MRGVTVFHPGKNGRNSIKFSPHFYTELTWRKHNTWSSFVKFSRGSARPEVRNHCQHLFSCPRATVLHEHKAQFIPTLTETALSSHETLSGWEIHRGEGWREARAGAWHVALLWTPAAPPCLRRARCGRPGAACARAKWSKGFLANNTMHLKG